MAGEDGSQMRCSSKFTMDMLSREVCSLVITPVNMLSRGTLATSHNLLTKAHSPPLPGPLHVPVALGGQPLLGGAACSKCP